MCHKYTWLHVRNKKGPQAIVVFVTTGRKWKCSLIAVLIVLGACCLITFFVFEFHSSTSGQVFFEEGDAVMVSNSGFDPFYYTAFNFTRNDSSMHPGQ